MPILGYLHYVVIMDRISLVLVILATVLVLLQAPQLVLMVGAILGISIVMVNLFWMPWKQ